MNTLDEIGILHGTDKASDYHDYLRFYDRLLNNWRNEEFVMYEIGVFRGGSVATWADYFPRAKIVGIDIDPAARQYDADRVFILVGDGTDHEFLSTVVKGFGRPRLVIDDGSHLWQHQIDTFRSLFPPLLPGGLFIVEDLHTSFDKLAPEYSLDAPMSAVDYLQKVARGVVGSGWMNEEKPFDAIINPMIESMEFHKGACAIRKKS